MIVLIHDSKESPSQSLDKRILGVLNEHERLRVIDFHTHEPSVEIEAKHGLPPFEPSTESCLETSVPLKLSSYLPPKE